MTLLFDDKTTIAPIGNDEMAREYMDRLQAAPEQEVPALTHALDGYRDVLQANEAEQRQEHFFKLYNEPDYFQKVAESPEAQAAVGPAADVGTLRKEMANRAYISSEYGEDLQGVSYQFARDIYAQQHFHRVPGSEGEFFDLLKNELATKKHQKEAVNDLYEMAAFDAIKDGASGSTTFAPERMKELQARKPEAFRGVDEAQTLGRFAHTYDQVRKDMAPYQVQAKQVLDILGSYTGATTDNAFDPQGREKLDKLAQSLVTTPRGDRDKIYQIVGMAAKAMGLGDAKGFWMKLAESLGRGMDDVVSKPTRAFTEMQLRRQLKKLTGDDPNVWVEDGRATGKPHFFFEPRSAGAALAGTGRSPTLEERSQAILEMNNELRRLDVIRELKSIADGEVDPIKPKSGGLLGAAEGGLYMAARSAPLVAASFTGEAAPFLIGTALFGAEYDRMKLTYKGMEPDDVAPLASLSAALQLPFMMVRMQGVLGRLPATGRLLERMADLRLPLWQRVGAGIAGQVVEQNVLALAQQTVPIAIDSLSSSMRSDMPEFDAEAAFRGMAESAPETFFSILPLALIGGGFMVHGEVGRNKIFIADQKLLRIAGFSEKVAEEIAAQPDARTQAEMIHEQWRKRTDDDIKAGLDMGRQAAEQAHEREGGGVPELTEAEGSLSLSSKSSDDIWRNNGEAETHQRAPTAVSRGTAREAIDAARGRLEGLGIRIEEAAGGDEIAAARLDPEGNIWLEVDAEQIAGIEAGAIAGGAEPGSYARLLFGEETIHLAHLIALKAEWEAQGRPKGFDKFVEEDAGYVLNDIRATHGQASKAEQIAIQEAVLATYRSYFGRFDREIDAHEDFGTIVDRIQSNKRMTMDFVTEFLRHAVQLRKQGEITETIFAKLYKNVADWVARSISAVHKYLPGVAEGKFGEEAKAALTKIERVLDETKIGPMRGGDVGEGGLSIGTKSPSGLSSRAKGATLESRVVLSHPDAEGGPVHEWTVLRSNGIAGYRTMDLSAALTALRMENERPSVNAVPDNGGVAESTAQASMVPINPEQHGPSEKQDAESSNTFDGVEFKDSRPIHSWESEEPIRLFNAHRRGEAPVRIVHNLPDRAEGEAISVASVIAGLFKRKVVLFDGGDKAIPNPQTGKMEPTSLEGMVLDKDGVRNFVFLNKDTHHPHMFVVGHEIYHHIENTHPELAAKVAKELRALIKDRKAIDEAKWHYPEGRRDHEVFADFFGESLGKKEVWRALANRNPKVFSQFATLVQEWLGKVMEMLESKGYGASKHFTDVAKARRVVVDALAEFSKHPTGPDGP